MVTFLAYNDIFAGYNITQDNPETKERVTSILDALGCFNNDQLIRGGLCKAHKSDITLVHDERYYNKIIDICDKINDELQPEFNQYMLGPDVVIMPGTIEAALYGAGAAITCVKQVLGNANTNAFALSRPPGHHAETSKAMGFCYFNNAAIAARYAQKHYGLKNILIYDFDVHHGNGTQEIFYNDPTVLYCSTHQMPLYPGTGEKLEVGCGNIINCPLKRGEGIEEIIDALNTVISVAIQKHKPELVILSAGFDGHIDDPLGGLTLTNDDYKKITKVALGWACEYCDKKLISILEGGYNILATARAAATHVDCLVNA